MSFERGPVLPLISLLKSKSCKHLVQREVDIEELQGKTVALYFARNRSVACQEFTNKLADVYDELQEIHAEFEVVFIADDENNEQFSLSLREMPWLALPYNEREIESLLAEHLKIQWLPCLVILAPDGRTVLSLKGQSLILRYGASAYPFTEEHLSSLKEKQNAKALEFPRKLLHPSHKHELMLGEDDDKAEWGYFVCSLCKGQGGGWVYECPVDGCNYKMHPGCVDPTFEFEEVDETSEKFAEEVIEELVRAIAIANEEEIQLETLENGTLPSEEVVNAEAKKVFLSGFAAAFVAFAVGVCTSCCISSLVDPEAPVL